MQKLVIQEQSSFGGSLEETVTLAASTYRMGIADSEAHGVRDVFNVSIDRLSVYTVDV